MRFFKSGYNGMYYFFREDFWLEGVFYYIVGGMCYIVVGAGRLMIRVEVNRFLNFYEVVVLKEIIFYFLFFLW